MIINNSINIPEYNLALEEYLCSLKKDFFMLWRNIPSVIIGRFNNLCDLVNLEYAKSNNIHVIRRNSGGGAVYHDLGNINYTFILDDNKNFTLEYFSNIIIRTLQNIGIKSNLTFSHNDILADNKKISGAAQHHNKGVILHHGTLLFDSDLSVIPKVLKNSSSVTNIKPFLKHDFNINDFMNLFRDNICFNNICSDEIFTLSDNDNVIINKIMQSKYLNSNWNLEASF